MRLSCLSLPLELDWPRQIECPGRGESGAKWWEMMADGDKKASFGSLETK